MYRESIPTPNFSRSLKRFGAILHQIISCVVAKEPSFQIVSVGQICPSFKRKKCWMRLEKHGGETSGGEETGNGSGGLLRSLEVVC